MCITFLWWSMDQQWTIRHMLNMFISVVTGLPWVTHATILSYIVGWTPNSVRVSHGFSAVGQPDAANAVTLIRPMSVVTTRCYIIISHRIWPIIVMMWICHIRIIIASIIIIIIINYFCINVTIWMISIDWGIILTVFLITSWQTLTMLDVEEDMLNTTTNIHYFTKLSLIILNYEFSIFYFQINSLDSLFSQLSLSVTSSNGY